MQTWECPTRHRPRANGLSRADSRPREPTNPMRLLRNGRRPGWPAPTHAGRPNRRSTPTRKIRRAPRGGPDGIGPKPIPTGGRIAISGWLIPIGVRPTRHGGCPEPSRLVRLVSGCSPPRGGCGTRFDRRVNWNEAGVSSARADNSHRESRRRLRSTADARRGIPAHACSPGARARGPARHPRSLRRPRSC